MIVALLAGMILLSLSLRSAAPAADLSTGTARPLNVFPRGVPARTYPGGRP
jgi:hypothetical protein